MDANQLPRVQAGYGIVDRSRPLLAYRATYSEIAHKNGFVEVESLGYQHDK